MKKTAGYLLSFFAMILLHGCHNGWTEEERRAFDTECAQTDTFSNLGFSLTGFSWEEVHDIIVRRRHNGQVADTFVIHPDENSYDSVRTRYRAAIPGKVYVKDNYEFVVPGQQTFILSDMKMIMWAQYTMFSEGWGCTMGHYKIDTTLFEHNANPDFTKKGFVLFGEKAPAEATP